MSFTRRPPPVLTDLVTELIAAHRDSMELLSGGGLGSPARWHVAYLQEQVRAAQLQVANADGRAVRDGGDLLLDLAEDLLETHLDTVDLLVDLRPSDKDIRLHVVYLKALQRAGRAIVALMSAGGARPAPPLIDGGSCAVARRAREE